MKRRFLPLFIVILALHGLFTPSARAEVKLEEAELIRAAVPKQATVKPTKVHKILVLSYQSHNAGRFAGEKALEIMAEQTGAFSVEFVRDTKALAEAVVPDVLNKYDAVCVNNSTGG
jgi:hypothetical protein